ncbi:MAG: methionine--tRNA ligase subunit beta [Candidatus Hodarchaeales archaeon]|jgi:methionyl-tRNA synthetase
MAEKEQTNEETVIDYEDFAKLTIKVAKIVKVEEIPKSDKLLKITINVGEVENRTIVAGIKETYEPEKLIGSQIIVLTNLKPRKVFGVKSNGMLLAASVDNKAVLLRPDKEIPEGSKIR